MQEFAGQDDLAEVLQAATRDFLALALHSLDAAPDVGPAHMRLLFAVHDHERQPSSVLASILDISASSVTRQADKLCRSGHLTRRPGDTNRSIVVLELTERGQRAVDDVVAWRAKVFDEAIRGIDPHLYACTARGLHILHESLARLSRQGYFADSQ